VLPGVKLAPVSARSLANKSSDTFRAQTVLQGGHACFPFNVSLVGDTMGKSRTLYGKFSNLVRAHVAKGNIEILERCKDGLVVTGSRHATAAMRSREWPATRTEIQAAKRAERERKDDCPVHTSAECGSVGHIASHCSAAGEISCGAGSDNARAATTAAGGQ
jgi:hypothetical protein